MAHSGGAGNDDPDDNAYAQKQNGGDKPAGGEAKSKDGNTDDVVDAEFEEVDDRKK